MGRGHKREEGAQSAPSRVGRNQPSAELVGSLETVDMASLLATGRCPVALMARMWEELCTHYPETWHLVYKDSI